MSSAGASSTSSAMSSWPGVTISAQIAICFFLAIAVAWLVIGIPTLIGVGWNNTSSKAEASNLSLLRTQTQNGFALQNNAVQSNFVAATQLPPGTVNVGGLNGVATALPLTGDVTLSPNGVVRINRGAVTNSQLANPAQYIVSALPKDLPIVPSWRNSMSGAFTAILSNPFPFNTTAWAVSYTVRNTVSKTAVPSNQAVSSLMQLGGAFALYLLSNSELYMSLVADSTPLIQVPLTPLISNRASWTTFTFSQQLTPSGWVYTLYIDNLIAGTLTVATPLFDSTDNAPWLFNRSRSLEVAGVYVFLQANPLDAPITSVDLQRLFVLGPGNTYSSKINNALFAAYEFFNTPGFPPVVTTSLIQSFPNSIFPNQTLLPALNYTLYADESLAMLIPNVTTSVAIDFVMPINVSSVTVTILVEVVIPYNTTPPATLQIALVLYGSTIAENSFLQNLTVNTSLPEQTFVIEGIPTTANNGISQKWTAEVARDDFTGATGNPVWVGIESLVIQGIVA